MNIGSKLGLHMAQAKSCQEIHKEIKPTVEKTITKKIYENGWMSYVYKGFNIRDCRVVCFCLDESTGMVVDVWITIKELEEVEADNDNRNKLRNRGRTVKDAMSLRNERSGM